MTPRPRACWRSAAHDACSGEVLFRLGDSAGSVYLITRGCIRLTLPMQVRDREENVLVEEQADRPHGGLERADAALPLHPHRHRAARDRGGGA